VGTIIQLDERLREYLVRLCAN